MNGKETEIKYHALVLTPDRRFYEGEATIYSDKSIHLSLSFDDSGCGYEVGDRIPILDILVDPSSRQDLLF